MAGQSVIIVNPNAGGKDALGVVRDWADSHVDLRWLDTKQAGDAEQFAKDACRDGVTQCYVAGGDGTVCEAVNGFMNGADDIDHRPTMIIIPFGTGNDYCRSIGIPQDTQALLDQLKNIEYQQTDVMQISWNDQTRYGINAITAGFAPALGETMTDELKETWGQLAYLRATVNMLKDHQPYQVRRTLAAEEKTLELVNLVIGNGQYACGGAHIAPHAKPDDGQLDIVTCEAAGFLKELVTASRTLVADYTKSDIIQTHRTTSLTVTPIEPPLPVNIDGEFLGHLTTPIRITIHPAALRVGVLPSN